MIMYGLRIKGKKDLLKVSTRSNSDGEFCCDTQFILEDSNWDYPIWLVNKRKQAEKVAKESTDWYNAGYETPTWDNEDWDLEVVEVELIVKG